MKMLVECSIKWDEVSKCKIMFFILVLLIFREVISGQNGKPVKETQYARQKILINDNWKFYPSGLGYAYRADICDENWGNIDLPHTWNVQDPFDDEDSYRRGISWYRKHLILNPEWKGKKLFLYFEGANQVSTIFVNGVFAGEHKGGYTAFTVDITDHLIWDAEDNLIAVRVNNDHDRFIPPLSVGYALYGGIYRDVWLVVTSPVHFDMEDYGSPGFYIKTPVVSDEQAKIFVEGIIVNEEKHDNLTLEGVIKDSIGSVILSEKIQLESNIGKTPIRIDFKELGKPQLWSPENPYLYNLELIILKSGQVMDRVTADFGLRWFSFHPEEGFSLNGIKYKLKGTNRHQDYKNLGSALSNEIHYQDMQSIKEMGCNFVRLAHYPQDPAVLDAADQLGLLIWEEIPLVNYITTGKEFIRNAGNMLVEMIRQHINHPSVIIWGSMNEILLWSKEGQRIRSHQDNNYTNAIKELAKHIDEIIRKEDPYRYSAMAIHSSRDYFTYNISDIPMILGINLYHGWYSGTFNGFSNQLKQIHNRYPELVIFVSEYGAGSDIRLESTEPEQFDFTGSYQLLYHESHLQQINQLDFLAGTAIWNQYDFSQPQIGGTMPHLNQKGMMTWDRKPKDVYYLYKINWNTEPDIYISSRNWGHRIGISDDTAELALTQELCVYSNAGPVELFVNGKSLGIQTPDEICKSVWKVTFQPGINKITTKSVNKPDIYDEFGIMSTVLPQDFDNLNEQNLPLCINVGSNAQYTGQDGVVWLSDKPYSPGNYGFIEGKSKMTDRHLVIKGTDDEPLYYSYREGIREYKVDLPPGDYTIELLFLEPEFTGKGQRVFNVNCNGNSIRKDFTLTRNCGSSIAYSEAFDITVSQKENLIISFIPVKQKPVLNGIKIQKVQ